MKKFFIKFVFYLIPLPIYLGIILLIDPFNYVGTSNWITDETKISVTENLNPQLWKLQQFKHNKSSRIILGDSRSAKIKPYHIKKLTGLDYYNFAYPGGTLADIIETFWYADSYVKLEEVYIGLNFNLYNGFETNNNVIRSKNVAKNFFSYAFSKIVFSTSIKCIKKQFFVRDMKFGRPDMSFDDFWTYELNIIGDRFYQKYKHPDQSYHELIKIANYCKENKIKLVFFMPPNHVDWQNRITYYNLQKDNERFINEISSIGILHNLDVPNIYTTNKKNFFDPMHPRNDSVLVNTLWETP